MVGWLVLMDVVVVVRLCVVIRLDLLSPWLIWHLAAKITHY
jgi:hypothetical protein